MRIQINQAAGILAVFWAMVRLSSENETHTVDNIRKRLFNKDAPKVPDPNTLNQYLDYLELYGAAKFTYPRGERRGRHDVAKLNPYNIPPSIYNKKPGRTTRHEWGKILDGSNELLDNQTLAIWRNGVRVINMASFSDEMKQPLRNIVDWAKPIAEYIYDKQAPKELTFDAIVSKMQEEPVRLEGRYLKSFYRYILLLFLFTYPHDWEQAPYADKLRDTEKMFRRSVSFLNPNLYAEFALDRKVIVLHHKGA
jgi:hypothetical protein